MNDIDYLHYAQSEKKCKITKKYGNFYYTISSKINHNITRSDIKKYLNYENKLNWSTFDEYKVEAFKVYRIYFDETKWENSECNCFKFLKEYKCKHVLGLAIRFKLVSVPNKAKQVKLDKKTSRGRKPKAASALVKN